MANNIPLVLLVACLIAESGLNPFAAREGDWPDVSYGLGQQICLYANGYGIGNGEDTPSNRAICKAALFDRKTSINIAASHLRDNYVAALGYYRPVDDSYGDSLVMLALTAYNSGSPREPGSAWYQEYAGNVSTYKNALVRAHGMVLA